MKVASASCPRKRQRGVSSPNLCICCATSSVGVGHINPAGVKGIGEPGNVGTNAVTCNAIFDATHLHGAGLSRTDNRYFSAASKSRIVLCGAIISAPRRDG